MRARRLGASAMTELAQSFASRSKIFDRTLPIVALMDGRKLTAIYRGVFGDARSRTCGCRTSRCRAGSRAPRRCCTRRGPLWRAVRASTALPAIFPPMIADDREVLVDGNVMNNMPLDVMRERCESGHDDRHQPDAARAARRRPTTAARACRAGRRCSGASSCSASRLRAPSIVGSVMRATEINSANRMRQPSFRASPTC